MTINELIIFTPVGLWEVMKLWALSYQALEEKIILHCQAMWCTVTFVHMHMEILISNSWNLWV